MEIMNTIVTFVADVLVNTCKMFLLMVLVVCCSWAVLKVGRYLRGILLWAQNAFGREVLFLLRCLGRLLLAMWLLGKAVLSFVLCILILAFVYAMGVHRALDPIIERLQDHEIQAVVEQVPDGGTSLEVGATLPPHQR